MVNTHIDTDVSTVPVWPISEEHKAPYHGFAIEPPLFALAAGLYAPWGDVVAFSSGGWIAIGPSRHVLWSTHTMIPMYRRCPFGPFLKNTRPHTTVSPLKRPYSRWRPADTTRGDLSLHLEAVVG